MELFLTVLLFTAPISNAEMTPARPLAPVASPLASGGDFLLVDRGSYSPPQSPTASGGDFSFQAETSAPANSQGACPCQSVELIFTDGFESGGTGAWTSSQN